MTLTKSLRTNQTPWEAKMWYYLRGNRFQGVKFKRQVAVDNYIVDFCCQEVKLIIELDGGHHGQIQDEDLQRQLYLEAKGYKVLRFWNSEVKSSLEGVLETIRRNINQKKYKNVATSPPTSPHHLGRGGNGRIR